jgi:hypothetical protein
MVKISLRYRPPSTGLVFCDETCNSERYFAIGATLFAANDPKSSDEVIASLEAQLVKIKQDHGLTGRIKWAKVPTKRGKKLDGYKALLRFFLTDQHLYFKAMLVDTSVNPLGNRRLWQGNPLTGYLKFYCVFLADGVMQRFPNYFYRITMDTYTFPPGTDSKFLEHTVEGRYVRKVKPEAALSHCELTTCPEESSQLLQLTDLLLGAVGFAWNGGKSRTSRRAATRQELVQFLEEELKLDLSHCTTWSKLKFNIWLLQPRSFPTQGPEALATLARS